jgi:hypothetical protein
MIGDKLGIRHSKGYMRFLATGIAVGSSLYLLVLQRYR